MTHNERKEFLAQQGADGVGFDEAIGHLIDYEVAVSVADERKRILAKIDELAAKTDALIDDLD